MSEKKDIKPGDELIREALYHELESIDPPPTDEAWQRIEAELNNSQSRTSPKMKQDHQRSHQQKFSWTRYHYGAAAAAVILVVVLGSLGIFNQWDLAVLPALEDQAPVEEMEQPEAMEVEEDKAVPGIMVEEEALADDLPFFRRESDPAPPDWQQSLPDDFRLEDVFLLTEGEALAFHGATYYRNDESLLWVKVEADHEETEIFMENLGKHLQVEVQKVGAINGYTHFEAAGQPGLAWREDEQNQALLVKSGTVSVEQLKNIAAGIK